MSICVHICRQGLFSGFWPRWTVLARNITKKHVPRKFFYKASLVTTSPLQQIKISSLICCRGQRGMCTRIQVDQFTQLPLEDPQKGQLIYSGPLTRTIRAVKILSLSTSTLGLCMQPVILMRSAEASLFLKIAFSSFFSFFIFITPLLIHMISKKYVTGAYFEPNSKTFTASKYSFFCRSLEMKFTAEDVKVPDVAGPFTSLIVKDTALFMDPKFFLDKNAYIHLMGFDKPLDWELPRPNDKESSKK